MFQYKEPEIRHRTEEGGVGRRVKGSASKGRRVCTSVTMVQVPTHVSSVDTIGRPKKPRTVVGGDGTVGVEKHPSLDGYSNPTP